MNTYRFTSVQNNEMADMLVINWSIVLRMQSPVVGKTDETYSDERYYLVPLPIGGEARLSGFRVGGSTRRILTAPITSARVPPDGFGCEVTCSDHSLYLLCSGPSENYKQFLGDEASPNEWTAETTARFITRLCGVYST